MRAQMGASPRLLLAGMLVACSPEPSSQPNKESPGEKTDVEADRAAVLGTFEAYRGALLAKDGKRSLALVDRGTIDTYEQLLGQVRTVDRAGLERLDWSGKMSVLLARHEFDAAALAGMTGASMFMTGVERGWIDAGGVRDIKVARVEVAGEVAWLSLAQAPGVPMFHFVKQAGDWKIELDKTWQWSSRSCKRRSTSPARRMR